MSALGAHIVASIDANPTDWRFADNGTRFNHKDGAEIGILLSPWRGPVLRVGRGPGFSLLDKIRVWRAIRRWKAVYLATKLGGKP